MKRLLVVLLIPLLSVGQEIKRPTSDASGTPSMIGCQSGTGGLLGIPNAYDSAGLTTSSTMLVQAEYKSTRSGARVLSGWTAPSFTYSSLTLNVNASSPGSLTFVTGVGTGSACIAYSTDSGHTWTQIVCDGGGGWTQQTYSVSLSAGQDLTKVQVGFCVGGQAILSNSDNGGDAMTIFDVWTAGAGAPVIPGNGSGAGQAHRGIVIVN